jgi:hypothetical protein
MNNGGNIAKYLSDKEILASYYMKTSTFTNQLKCCDDHVSELIIFVIDSIFILIIIGQS